MKLAELCEPLFQYVCLLNRSASKGAAYDRDQVRSELEMMFADMASKAASDPALRPETLALHAGWRADPALAGVGGCSGDIGVHAFNIAEFVTGAPVERLCADLAAVVPGRTLDDDCNVLLRFAGGARGVLVASQICAGARNGLKLLSMGMSADYAVAIAMGATHVRVGSAIFGARH